MQVSQFKWDRFHQVDVFSLVEGDQVIVAGSMVTVAAPAYEKDGQVHLPAAPIEQAVILVDFSDTAATRAMDYVGSSVHDFGDGTAIIAELDGSTDLVYSPRLPKAELEAFCQEHLERYRAFNSQHSEAIEEGEPVPMEPWWA
ncbi:hypothetical protein P5706_36070 [Pseudomonas sp. ChxA]|uniref:hypothetical protein n=1 Tax=Pseudomonas TaxID=286 RepID=UPI0009977A25|nr:MULTISPECIES: hypothetical protein [Pseudomonas]MBF6043362.1 hypothetical protein [Pseudomonas mucoides]MBJ2202587.1 hypothetical protein [Pseudomonas carnis]MDL2189594.1 hypothetical protein [Pseudomonas sp. ChxA]OOW07017.1 hypothetical protein MF6394_01815 [Pseudomonas sp. MF6394]WHT75640.1 hypothetical protein QMY54_00375 [Pseudomonas rhodesiae]